MRAFKRGAVYFLGMLVAAILMMVLKSLDIGMPGAGGRAVTDGGILLSGGLYGLLNAGIVYLFCILLPSCILRRMKPGPQFLDLGVRLTTTTADTGSGAPGGATVVYVYSGSIAEDVGIRENMILVSLNGSPITKAEQVLQACKRYEAGTTMEIVAADPAEGYAKRSYSVEGGKPETD